ncbi:MAG TPA: hypothetical protein VFT60_10055 [Bryobacteraceae bacterium]|nr:hypothetical protein [Bryobacteraceae bacterium]
MPTITVKLDKKQAAKLTRWARADKITKSAVVRNLIDHGGPIKTTDDLIAWGEANVGRGAGLRQKTS